MPSLAEGQRRCRALPSAGDTGRGPVYGLLAVGVLALGACQTAAPATNSNNAGISTAPVIVEQRVAEAALRAEQALHQLSRIRSAEQPLVIPLMPARVPTALLSPLTIEWTGPLVPFVRKLAAEAGYAFTETGTPPVEPVIIIVTARDRPAIALLRDAGLQAGQRAAVSVDARRERIEVVHAPDV